MKMLWRWMITILFGLQIAGCVDVGRSPASPAPFDLTGTWTGMVGPAGSGSALRMTWIASQSGAFVTGPMTLIKPVPNVPATGTLSGTISGIQVVLTYVVPAGSVTGLLSCSISGRGLGSFSAFTMTGALELTFTSCDGADSGLVPPATNDFSLTKQ